MGSQERFPTESCVVEGRERRPSGASLREMPEKPRPEVLRSTSGRRGSSATVVPPIIPAVTPIVAARIRTAVASIVAPVIAPKITAIVALVIAPKITAVVTTVVATVVVFGFAAALGAPVAAGALFVVAPAKFLLPFVARVAFPVLTVPEVLAVPTSFVAVLLVPLAFFSVLNLNFARASSILTKRLFL